jgi:hypothetical protein
VLYSADQSSPGNKTFVIDHPTDPLSRYLVHACLEGPEVGIYYRGEGEIVDNNKTTITLPNYVSALGSEFTVHVTQIFEDDDEGECEFVQFAYSRVVGNRFTVYCSSSNNVKFSWLVHAKRREHIDIEPYKSSVQVKGQGPYKWI